MKELILATILFVTNCTAFAQTTSGTYSIKAFLPFWNGSTIQLKAGEKLLHVGTVQRDMFSCTGNISKATEGVLEIRKENTTLFVPLFIEPGTIKIRDKGSRVLEAVGTKNNDEYLQAQQQIDSVTKNAGLPSAAGINLYKRNQAAAYIQQHPQSPVSLKLLHDYYYRSATNDTAYFSLFSLLSPELKNTAAGKKIGREATAAQTTALGVQAANLLLRDTAGNQTPLYNPGQITLVNFWGSWCRPCRREHPELVKLYNQYHELGFTISSISLDVSTAPWKKAIVADGLVWKQLSDLQGWGGSSAEAYGIKSIPDNFLLDRNGIIIGRNLSPHQLAQILSNQLKTKTF